MSAAVPFGHALHDIFVHLAECNCSVMCCCAESPNCCLSVAMM